MNIKTKIRRDILLHFKIIKCYNSHFVNIYTNLITRDRSPLQAHRVHIYIYIYCI